MSVVCCASCRSWKSDCLSVYITLNVCLWPKVLESEGVFLMTPHLKNPRMGTRCTCSFPDLASSLPKLIENVPAVLQLVRYK